MDTNEFNDSECGSKREKGSRSSKYECLPKQPYKPHYRTTQRLKESDASKLTIDDIDQSKFDKDDFHSITDDVESSNGQGLLTNHQMLLLQRADQALEDAFSDDLSYQTSTSHQE